MVTTVTDNSPQSINTSLFAMDGEIQKVKKIAESFDEKLSGIDIETGVLSVNGKQGVVELTASDVDALPSSTVIPTTTSELTNDSGFITSSGSITGNAATATRAEQDANGNVITDTYATKTDLSSGLSDTADSLQNQITANKSAIDTLNGTGTGSVQKTVTDEIAKVVANAPEDFDTLKEISDWIDTHEDSASAMNTQIQANKNEIASLKTEVAGKADKTHTHSASDITSGTLPIARGGTGQTTQADINKAFVGELEEGTSDVTDGTMFVSSYASDNGFADTNAVNVPYKRKFLTVWNYIKGKISSVLGLSTDGLSSKGNITVPDNKYIRAICASNDYVQIMGSGTSDSGSGEISTGDNGNEPLYARQRDVSNNVTHEITLLDANGNQKFNTVTANGFIGNLSGKASTAGTADNANVPTGFEKIGTQDTWGNKDGVFITDWQTVQKGDLADSGNISFRFNNGQLNLLIDGVFYQDEGKYKLVDENSIKNIMKPNYTTGRFPAGMYRSGETVSISASITTTRGNPVFISYFGDFNSVSSGEIVPWVWFALYADGVLLQRTSVDNSSALNSDNTSFAGSALAVLSAGSHTIRLDAELLGGSPIGQIQFQEQENYVNLVAFEL